MRGFGCESRAVRWVAVRSLKTVWTCGICRSEWRVWLETYHGALVIDMRSLDWYRWMIAMLDLENVRVLCVLDRASSWYLNKGWPTRWHMLYYILLNMFQTLIRPSSGASEYLLCCVGWLEACWCYVAGLAVGDVVSECRLNHLVNLYSNVRVSY